MLPMEMGIDLEGDEPGEVSKCIVSLERGCGKKVEQYLVICCGAGVVGAKSWYVDTRRMLFASRHFSASRSTEANTDGRVMTPWQSWTGGSENRIRP